MLGYTRSALKRTSTLISQCRHYAYTAEHESMKDNLMKLIEREINPHCDKWEKDQIFPAHEVFKILGDNGYLGISKPVEYGGLGLDYSYEIVAAGAYGYINCGGVSMAIGVQCDMATPALAKYGSHHVKENFLKPTIAGDYVACLGVSEVGSGSDVSSIKSRAHVEGNEWVINGGKMWTTNGTQADWMCMLVNSNDNPNPHRSKSLICVPMNTKGVSVHRKIKKMGMHSSDTAEITMENVRVPLENLIGEEGKGFQQQMNQFQNERIYAAAGALPAMDRAIQATIEYTSQRQAFGKSILDNQYVHYRLAELQTEVECLRALLNQCVEQHVAGEDITPLATMLKLKSGRLVREVTDSCLQFWGGMGYTDDVIISRLYRDTRLMSIGGGADEVMLNVICKYMGIDPGSRS